MENQTSIEMLNSMLKCPTSFESAHFCSVLYCTGQLFDRKLLFGFFLLLTATIELNITKIFVFCVYKI